MFESVTPESVGISSSTILSFLKRLDYYNICTHDIIMARGNKIFFECYYKPFHKDFKHRMYSISKSFVAIAIGCAIDDGLLKLSDKFVSFFPEYINKQTNDYLMEATIEDMLTMETSMYEGVDWFSSGTDNRTEVYFEKAANKIPGTMFDYDSPGSYMLGVIVEKLTGMPFLEYLQKKVLSEIGFSKDTYCLKVPSGHSFADSGIMCTARDLLTFARFVMNKGRWGNVQYINKDFMERATSKIVSNNNWGVTAYTSYGYGYQIWKAPNNGFVFYGMGDQFAICDPSTDFIFIINSDNQGNGQSAPILFHELYNSIIPAFAEALPEDCNGYQKLQDYADKAELMHLPQSEQNPFEQEVNNVKYKLNDNPMKIEYIKFGFDGKKGTMIYKNAQGEKELHFGMGYNEFGNFPEEGYSDIVATEYSKGNLYKCACSGTWEEKKKLHIKVQIIDKYFGNADFTFSFKDNRVMVMMIKNAEAFMEEYSGLAIGEKV